MSTSATPSSLLVRGERRQTAGPMGFSTSCSTSRPQRRTHLTMFSAADCAPVTIWTRTSRRPPLMPIGSLTSWPSITNSCGSTSSKRWSLGMLMALAVSTTRATSTGVTSLSRTITIPVLFCPRIWLPVIPVKTRVILQSAIISASLSADWIDCTVASMLTTTPRFRPWVGAMPKPARRNSPPGMTSATTAMILAVPISRPTTRSLYSLAIRVSLLSCPGWAGW
jgi:hypothetical protein